EPFLLGGGPLRRRHCLEAGIRDRLAALDRHAVGAGGKPLLRTVDGGKLEAQVLGEAFVELGVVEIRRLICEVLVGGRGLVARYGREPRESLLDAPALTCEELACTIWIHATNLPGDLPDWTHGAQGSLQSLVEGGGPPVG